MKRFLTVLLVFLSLAGTVFSSDAQTKKVNRSRIEALVGNLREGASSKSSNDDSSISLPGLKVFSKGGVDIVSVSKFWVKSIMKYAGDGDKDVMEAANLLKSVSKIMIVSYEECDERAKADFSKKITKTLDGCEKFMEAKDGGETMAIYGTSSKDGKSIDDIVFFSPENHTLICFFGTLDTDRLGEFVEKASK